jgi:hypothetical protein
MTRARQSEKGLGGSDEARAESSTSIYFTGFPSTKVQMLTRRKALQTASSTANASVGFSICNFVLVNQVTQKLNPADAFAGGLEHRIQMHPLDPPDTLLALLVQKYKY